MGILLCSADTSQTIDEKEDEKSKAEFDPISFDKHVVKEYVCFIRPLSIYYIFILAHPSFQYVHICIGRMYVRGSPSDCEPVRQNNHERQ